MKLPIYKDDNNNFMLMQTNWSSLANPVLSNPISNGSLLKSIAVIVGDNVINHKLGRNLQGWIVVGLNASATFYDKQSTNSTPDKTLILNSSAIATINLYVF